MALPEAGSPTVATLLGRLEATVKQRNAACYWPGPWTLDENRADQLIGREDHSD